MSDSSDEEEEFEFYDYGRDRDDADEIIVAGGGLRNGNAYATVKDFKDGRVLYREYGRNAITQMHRNHTLQWNGSNFNIITITTDGADTDNLVFNGDDLS